VKVKFTARGARRARLVNGWWQEHRADAPLLFQEELEEAKRQLLENPHVGRPYKRIEGRLFRQLLLERSQQWVYYRVLEEEELIVIHSIWGSQRGTEPKLD
jgi:plasmid stabilization system protein ParE